jgi:replicative DNA helicase
VSDELDQSGMPVESVLDAERCVVATAMTSREDAEIAAEILTPAAFFMTLHGAVFAAVLAMLDDGEPIEPTALRPGDGAALAGLPGWALNGQIGHYARVVASDYRRREIRRVGYLTLAATAAPDFEPDAGADAIRQRLDAATAGLTAGDPPAVVDVLNRVLDRLEEPISVDHALPPPYKDLQFLISGMTPGQVVAVGARPAIGKSVVALDFARFAALRLGLWTLYFSLEMPADELMERMLAAEAGVDLAKIRAHDLNDSDYTKLAKVSGRIAEAPLIIDDTPECGLARIRARLRRMARTAPCRLVIIDYLQLMTTPKAESREQALAQISRTLKLMAKEFGVTIVLLCQLNRELEKRTDKRPGLHDFRETGAIEQDIDIALMLHREDAKDPESARAGELDIIVAKHRNGPTGTVTLAFQGHYTRAVDMVPAAQVPSGPSLQTWDKRYD